MSKTSAVFLCWLCASICFSATDQKTTSSSSREESSSTRTTSLTGSEDTSTDFLSDEHWRQLPREQRRQRFQSVFLRLLEPSGDGKVEKLDTYIERYKQAVCFDSRLAVFRVRSHVIDPAKRSIVLSGEVSIAQFKTGLEQSLRALGFDVQANNIELLPAKELGTLVYGISTTVSATMRKEPRPNAEQVNSIPLGWPARILRSAREDDLSSQSLPGRRENASYRHQLRSPYHSHFNDVTDWYLAQSCEGYVGFIRKGDFQLVSTYRLPDAYLVRPTTVTLSDRVPITIPTAAGLTRSAHGTYVLTIGNETIPFQGTPQSYHPLRNYFTPDAILTISQPYLGTPYVWGGVTNLGVDCSGFSQFIYRANGVHLPRDAEEQAIVGVIVGFGRQVREVVEPGDLIFFLNERGRISHVAVSLGKDRIIHASGNNVHISTLDERREDSDQPLIERVLFARRICTY